MSTWLELAGVFPFFFGEAFHFVVAVLRARTEANRSMRGKWVFSAASWKFEVEGRLVGGGRALRKAKASGVRRKEGGSSVGSGLGTRLKGFG